MTIETKFNVGDLVFFLHNDKVNQENINDIKAYRSVHTQYDKNLYGFAGISELFNESELFKSKADLLNSL